MLPDDEHFNTVINKLCGGFPFRALTEVLKPHEASDLNTLRQGFERVFHCEDAQAARNVVFFWAVDRPFHHESGHRLASTISYIEITKGSIARRWPSRYIKKITRDKKTAEGLVVLGLEQLAKYDKNLSFYSQLIREHGPLRVWYAGLEDLNQCARKANLSELGTIREWERMMIKTYRKLHGGRPLKNRRD